MTLLGRFHPFWRVTLRELPFYMFKNASFNSLIDNGFKYWSIFARNHIYNGFPTLKGFYKLFLFGYIVTSFTIKEITGIFLIIKVLNEK